jgi:hypothetical protein
LHGEVDIAVVVENFFAFLNAPWSTTHDSLFSGFEDHTATPFPCDVGIAVVVCETPIGMHSGNIRAAVSMAFTSGRGTAKFGV